MSRILRWSAALAAVLALTAVAAQAASDRRGHDRWSPRVADRVLVATTDQNQLVNSTPAIPSGSATSARSPACRRA